MKKYKTEITITGEDITGEVKTTITFNAYSKEDLFEQIKGWKVLNAKVSQDDFEFVRDMIKEKPQIIPAIKELIQDIEGKNLMQVTAAAPKYISKFKKILK